MECQGNFTEYCPDSVIPWRTTQMFCCLYIPLIKKVLILYEWRLIFQGSFINTEAMHG